MVFSSIVTHLVFSSFKRTWILWILRLLAQPRSCVEESHAAELEINRDEDIVSSFV